MDLASPAASQAAVYANGLISSDFPIQVKEANHSTISTDAFETYKQKYNSRLTVM